MATCGDESGQQFVRVTIHIGDVDGGRCVFGTRVSALTPVIKSASTVSASLLT